MYESSTAIITHNLTKKYGELVAVDHINLEIKSGEIFGLLGPNGAGKTTTIHMLSTILKPSEGTAVVAGYDIRKNPKEVRKRIGIVFQDMTIDRNLTAYENMWISGKLYGLSGIALNNSILELLDYVGLKDWKDVEVKKYSGGMIRRLEIARSLLHHPEILFLDEPTLGLDPQTRVHIWEYIRRIQKEKKITILLTTHYLEEADALCERLAIIDYGKIVAIGTPDELKSRISGDTIYLRVDGAHIDGIKRLVNRISEVLGVEPRILADRRLMLIVPNAPQVIPKIFQIASKVGVSIRELTYSRPSLNDVFIRLTGHSIRDSLGSFVDLMRLRRASRISRR